MSEIVTIEVDGIQEWILGTTTELRIIRGGSVVLDEVFRELEQVLEDALGSSQRDSEPAGPPAPDAWALPVCSSGSATVVVGSSIGVERVEAAVRGYMATALPDATVSLGHHAWTPDMGFAEARRHAAARMRPLVARVVSGHLPGTRLCTACGTASSDPRAPRVHDMSEPWYLCPSCRRRFDAVPDTGVLPEGVEPEPRVGDIGAATPRGRWHGYVATVCADGNAIGQRFASLSSPAELTAASSQLKADIDTALGAGLVQARDAHRRLTGDVSATLPVNLLMRAGDDIRLVVPAHVAPEVALGLADSHEAFTACVGVAITHAGVPFSVTHELAEDVLDRAKARARAQDERVPPAQIGMMVSSTSAPRDVPEDPLRGSPYDTAGFRALLDAAEQLRAPNHAIRRVADSLQVGGRVADREWQLFRRDLPPIAAAELAALWRALGADDLNAAWPLDDQALLASLDLAGDARARTMLPGGTPARRSPLRDLLILSQLREAPVEGAASRAQEVVA
jgi:hypothetical protein